MFFVTDLDGTLLNKESVLSDYTRQGLMRMLARNLPFTIATGRGYASLREVVGDISIQYPIACFDGALVCQIDNPRPLRIASLSSDLVREALSIIRYYNFEAFVDVHHGSSVKIYYETLHEPGSYWYYQFMSIKPESILKYSHFPEVAHEGEVLSIVIVAGYERAKDLLSALENTFVGESVKIDFERSIRDLEEHGLLWIQNASATKSNALEFICQKTGHEREEVRYFGDQYNDLSIFRNPHFYSIAVSNAVDIIREQADEVIGSCDEDAVVRYIEETWKK